MSTVKTSALAFQTLTQMQSTISGPLMSEINNLLRLGKRLNDDQEWTGAKANEFRGIWQQTDTNLRKTLDDLEVLRGQVQQINQAIMEAGGGLG